MERGHWALLRWRLEEEEEYSCLLSVWANTKKGNNLNRKQQFYNQLRKPRMEWRYKGKHCIGKFPGMCWLVGYEAPLKQPPDLCPCAHSCQLPLPSLLTSLSPLSPWLAVFSHSLSCVGICLIYWLWDGWFLPYVCGTILFQTWLIIHQILVQTSHLIWSLQFGGMQSTHFQVPGYFSSIALPGDVVKWAILLVLHTAVSCIKKCP